MNDQHETPPESLGILEIETIHRGFSVIDGMAKAAPVRILTASPIPPGRFLIVIGGGVGEVETAQASGVELAGRQIHDHLFLAEVEPRLFGAIQRASDASRDDRRGSRRGLATLDALGLYETDSVAAGIDAADKGIKGAEVELHHLHIARGIRGKSFGLFAGRQDMVEAALAIAENRARTHQSWVGATLLARPDPKVAARVTATPWGFWDGQEIL